MQFNSIQPIDRALSGATIPGQSVPGSNSNEGVRGILQIITGTSQSDCFVSHQDTHWGWGLTPLQRCSRYILEPQPTGRSTSCIYIHLNECKQMTDAKLLVLHSNT